MTNTSLAEIATQIKLLEKKSIANVVTIGRLLHVAHEQVCEHGEYMKWLKSEFGWSHGTALNYRNVYELSENRKIYDFAKLDISVSALYMAARLLKDDEPDHRGIGEAILEASKQGRVSYSIAKEIAGKYLNAHPETDAPEPEAEPEEDEPDDDEAEPDATKTERVTITSGPNSPKEIDVHTRKSHDPPKTVSLHIEQPDVDIEPEPAPQTVSVAELTEKLTPIIKKLKKLGLMNMATMSPAAVAVEAGRLQNLLNEWRQRSVADRAETTRH